MEDKLVLTREVLAENKTQYFINGHPFGFPLEQKDARVVGDWLSKQAAYDLAYIFDKRFLEIRILSDREYIEELEEQILDLEDDLKDKIEEY